MGIQIGPQQLVSNQMHPRNVVEKCVSGAKGPSCGACLRLSTSKDLMNPSLNLPEYISILGGWGGKVRLSSKASTNLRTKH